MWSLYNYVNKVEKYTFATMEIWSFVQATWCRIKRLHSQQHLSDSLNHLNTHNSLSSVQSLHRVGLCNCMDGSTPGLPAHHRLPEFTQCPLSRWCHPTISSSVVPFFSCLQSFLASGSFPVSQFFTWGDQSIGVSALASVLSMNIQDWSPLGWTGWISLQSKGRSRVFSTTTSIH